MASLLQNKNRTIVPRWRLYKVTADLGELSGSLVNRQQPSIVRNFADLQEQFARHRTLWFATDLLSAAFVFQEHALGREAALFVLEHEHEASDAALELARRLISPALANGVSGLPERWETLIKDVRQHLRSNARDAVRWADLGLAHTVVGSREQALRCIRVAVQLAPDNRFVLRAASRCYLHWGEPDRAHWLLRRSRRTKSDPWLLSAEIAIASSKGQRSAYTTDAKRMLGDANLHAHSVSELAVALGGLELEHGSSRSAGRLFEQGMQDPTENSVAQLRWTLNKKNIDAPKLAESVCVPLLYEARASEEYEAGNWEAALFHADRWLSDQPFSSRPADLASYTASLLGRFDDAVRYIERAMASNANDPMMINNLAYFYVRSGDLDEADKTLTLLHGLSLDKEERLIVQATTGLIALRRGDVARGRALYHATLTQAWQPEYVRIRIVAGLNLAREEALLGNIAAAKVVFEEAERSARKVKGDKEIAQLVVDTQRLVNPGIVAGIT